MSKGMMGPVPLDAQGASITFENITSTFAHGLPVEYELLLRYLQRQPR